jgi:hypothetical protein
MQETTISIGDFNDLAFFNLFAYFIRLGQISGPNRHQRRQTKRWEQSLSSGEFF